MPLSLTKEQKVEATASMRRFVAEEPELEVSDIQTGRLLDYILTEIAPFAYNQGVEAARQQLSRQIEDLPGTCFEEPLTYWDKAGSSRFVRRKPGR